MSYIIHPNNTWKNTETSGTQNVAALCRTPNTLCDVIYERIIIPEYLEQSFQTSRNPGWLNAATFPRLLSMQSPQRTTVLRRSSCRNSQWSGLKSRRRKRRDRDVEGVETREKWGWEGVPHEKRFLKRGHPLPKIKKNAYNDGFWWNSNGLTDLLGRGPKVHKVGAYRLYYMVKNFSSVKSRGGYRFNPTNPLVITLLLCCASQYYLSVKTADQKH